MHLQNNKKHSTSTCSLLGQGFNQPTHAFPRAHPADGEPSEQGIVAIALSRNSIFNILLMCVREEGRPSASRVKPYLSL